uniref:Chromatin modification-related protein MEAF6 n=1 Tax=Physcomitrium patens TaxID=3218 RepID=A0A7I4CNY0_PHYPA
MSGQRVTSKPHQTLNLLNVRQDQLLEELRTVEKQLYDLETTYLHDSSQCGNVLKGFEGFLSSIKGSGNLKRPRKFQPEDRLFSLSSVTSPVPTYGISNSANPLIFLHFCQGNGLHLTLSLKIIWLLLTMWCFKIWTRIDVEAYFPAARSESLHLYGTMPGTW